MILPFIHVDAAMSNVQLNELDNLWRLKESSYHFFFLSSVPTQRAPGVGGEMIHLEFFTRILLFLSSRTPSSECKGPVRLQLRSKRSSFLSDQVRPGYRYLQEPALGARAREIAECRGQLWINWHSLEQPQLSRISRSSKCCTSSFRRNGSSCDSCHLSCSRMGSCVRPYLRGFDRVLSVDPVPRAWHV